MFEELVDSVVPGGFLIAVGVAIGAAFGKQLRPVAKEALKTGMVVAAQVQQAAAEAYERGQDLVAEAKWEHEAEGQNGRSTTRTTTRRTRTTSSS